MPEEKSPLRAKWYAGDWSFVTVLILLGAGLYSNTLEVPWYLDDVRSIVENPEVRRVNITLQGLFGERGIAMLTFALNHHFGGYQVLGYHLVNIAIHLATSCLVFLLLKRVFKERLLLAFGGALIFVSHPLQTQAVTYIVQRMTSLAGLFFFLAVYLYVLWRENASAGKGQNSPVGWGLYGGALLCGAMAVLTKQNTAVLPIALLLFDRYFMPQREPPRWQRQLAWLAPFCIVPLALGIKGFLLPLIGEGVQANFGGLPDLVHLRGNSPFNYLFTQFGVIWIYLRLLFIPYGQVLDYDVPIVTTWWHWPSLLGLTGILLLLGLAIWLRKRQPLISAGIFWFFLTLAVESSIIPLDPVFEHRLYIPMFGFVLVVMAGVALLPKRAMLVGIVLLTALLGVLTWQRNALWGDPLAFYEDNLRRAPRSERVRLDLGNLYLKHDRVAESQKILEEALAINPSYVLIHINLGRAYAESKDYRKAIAVLREGLRHDPSHFKLYNNLAVMLNVTGDFRGAAEALQRALHIEPDNATVYFNLGIAYDRLGQADLAVAQFRRAIAIAPKEPAYHFNLGNALFGTGDTWGALQAFLAAYRINPEHDGTLYNIALVYRNLGDLAAARNYAMQLQRIDPGLARSLFIELER